MAFRGPVLLLFALAALFVVAGCVGSTCPPGETPIGDVPANATDEVSIGGSITELSSSRIVLADGSGRALLVTLQGYDTSAASTGDCATADGTVIERSGNTSYDVVLRTSTVELRE